MNTSSFAGLINSTHLTP